jgi:hypothetical protein
MERSDQAGKLFAEDTLPYPNSVDGERPAHEERQASAHSDAEPGSPDDDMLAVEYREDEMRTAADDGDETPTDARQSI